MKNSILVAIIIVALTILSAITFVANRLLFADQPDLQNVISIIWTIALGAVLYRALLYAAPTKNVERQEWRQNFYGGLVFLCEMLAVLTLVVMAIVVSGMMTSGEPVQKPMALLMGVVTVLALSVPVGIRVIRSLNQRLVRAEGRPDQNAS
jgi:hypothetical protein